jgi:transcriptional regulator of heat shock response
MKGMSDWLLIDDKEIEKTYEFKNFTEAIDFLNKVADIAESENHHPDVSFAAVPHRERVYYLGLANVLKQPEFQVNPVLASTVVEVLENRLTTILANLEIDDIIRYYIGDEHVLPQIQSCGLLVKQYTIRGEKGVIGILGPHRMDYAFNTVALDLVSKLLD